MDISDETTGDLVFRLDVDADFYRVTPRTDAGRTYFAQHIERIIGYAHVPQRDAYARTIKPAIDVGLRVTIDCGVRDPQYIVTASRSAHVLKQWVIAAPTMEDALTVAKDAWGPVDQPSWSVHHGEDYPAVVARLTWTHEEKAAHVRAGRYRVIPPRDQNAPDWTIADWVRYIDARDGWLTGPHAQQGACARFNTTDRDCSHDNVR